ncbi:hypothetical protein EDD86DRAFT_217707 [Gorgonomyces haynaldii]|nr:hypothetical protein EDD86DRAFT_217707 [Gorgonomyces haynaldii]
MTPLQRLQALTEELEKRLGKEFSVDRQEAREWMMKPSVDGMSKSDLISAVSNGKLNHSQYLESHKRMAEKIKKHPIRREDLRHVGHEPQFMEPEEANVHASWDQRTTDELLLHRRFYLAAREELLSNMIEHWTKARELFLEQDKELPIAQSTLLQLDQEYEQEIARQLSLLQLESMKALAQPMQTEMPEQVHQVLERMAEGESYDSVNRQTDGYPDARQLQILERRFKEKQTWHKIDKKMACDATGLTLQELNDWFKTLY